MIDYDLSRYDHMYYEAFDGFTLSPSDTLPGESPKQRKVFEV